MYLRLLYACLASCTAAVLYSLIRCWIKQAHLREIPGPLRQSLWKGNLGQVFEPKAWDFHTSILKQYGRVVRLCGLFGDTQLYISDPRAMHHIILKDQHTYEETTVYITGNRLVLGMGLASTLGEHHRRQRKLLNPVFSIDHLRGMIPVFNRLSQRVADMMNARVAGNPQELEVMNWVARLAFDAISEAGFGYSFRALDDIETKNNPFPDAMKRIVPSLLDMGVGRNLVMPLGYNLLGPVNFRFLAQFIPWKALKDIINTADIIHNTSQEIMCSKKKAFQEGDEAVRLQVAEDRDITSALLRASVGASKEDQIPDHEVGAHMSTFISAATDNTSTTLCRLLWLLAGRQDVQDKLRDELTMACDTGKQIDYDYLLNLPYLDAIMRETLRLYPSVPAVSRTSRSDIILPLSSPVIGKDGNEMTEILIPNGTNVMVSIFGINRDPAIWGEDAAEWKPERWLSPLPSSVSDAHVPGVFGNMMTFLGGGRACIGFKFAQLEMKTLLVHLIPTFRFSRAKQEIIWKFGNVISPTVDGITQPMMPLMVEKIATSCAA